MRTSKDVSQNWKVGDSVNIGTLKGLKVTGTVQEGSLVKFILTHPRTQKEYTFVPGGLRKTYEPPTPAPALDHVLASKAIDRARSILTSRCRRMSDASMRGELQEVIAILSSTSVDGAANLVEAVSQPATDAGKGTF